MIILNKKLLDIQNFFKIGLVITRTKRERLIKLINGGDGHFVRIKLA